MIDRDVVRTLAAWETDGLPVTSLYLDVDGRRYPRRGDYVRRGEELAGKAREGADRRSRRGFASVSGDVQRITGFLNDDLDRKGPVRGVAMFSCSGAGRWEAVPLSQSVRDRTVVAPRPHVLPLESILEMAETFCTALIDRAKARILMSSLGEIEEVSHILDEVPGRHDQGGWAQGRLQRHIEDHVQRHLKHVADTLLRIHERRRFDRLVLSGSDETVAELERELHDYVRRTVIGRLSVPMSASEPEILERVMALERTLEDRREREAVDRVVAEASAGTGRAVTGMAPTLAAVEENRVDTLVIRDGLEADGVRCPSCGHLATTGSRCAVCGAATQEVSDLAEEVVEAALRHRCVVETVHDGVALIGGIGALLRF
jgi:peptide chain release factor subunit 1